MEQIFTGLSTLLPVSDTFHIKQTLFIILFITHLFASASTTKLFQIEQKNNKQCKKIALVSLFINNVHVTL